MISPTDTSTHRTRRPTPLFDELRFGQRHVLLAVVRRRVFRGAQLDGCLMSRPSMSDDDLRAAINGTDKKSLHVADFIPK